VFERFSLAAAVVGMMTFAQCRLHRKAVLEVGVFVVCGHVYSVSEFRVKQVACSAKSEGQGPLLGVLYDEIVRTRWDDFSSKEHSFRPGENAGEVHEQSRVRAVALYKTLFAGMLDASAAKPERKRAREEEVGCVLSSRIYVLRVVAGLGLGAQRTTENPNRRALQETV